MDIRTMQSAQGAFNKAPKGVYTQRVVPKEPVKTFYSTSNTGVADVFEQAANEGYQPLFIPELALAKIGSDEPWKNWFVTPSIRATGQTKAGSKVVVYAHVPNFYSNPENIRDAIKNGKLSNGAGAMPQEEFNTLVAQEGNGRVFVIPYEKLKEYNSGVINVEQALEHPQTLPFLGLGEEQAKAYLAKHKEMYGSNIGVWYTDDFDKKTPRGRVLFFGNGDINGLFGCNGLDFYGRVFAVAPEAQSVEKNSRTDVPLEQRVEKVGNDLVRVDGKLYMLVPASLTPQQ